MAKRFRWRFEAVKRAKEREEERRQQELAEALAGLRAEEAERDRALALQEQYRQQLREKQTGRLNTADISLINTYLETLSYQAETVETRIKAAGEIVRQKQEALMRTVRDRKVLENLRERDHQVFRKEERRRDQALMDEVAGRRKYNI